MVIVFLFYLQTAQGWPGLILLLDTRTFSGLRSLWMILFSCISAVRVARDDPRDEVRQRAVRDELCHSAVVVLRDKSPVELYHVRRVDLLEDVGLFVEIGNRILIHVAELRGMVQRTQNKREPKKEINECICLRDTFLIATSKDFL